MANINSPKEEDSNIPITTNIVTGKQPDGTETITFSPSGPTTAKVMQWDTESTAIHRVSGDILKDPLVNVGAPGQGTLITATSDGGKIYYLSNGYYLNLSEYLRKQDLSTLADIPTRDELKNFVSLSELLDRLKEYLTVESWNKKFENYYNKNEVYDFIEVLRVEVDKLPKDAYTKHQMDVIIGNIDKYSRSEVDTKISTLSDTIIKNSNTFDEALKEFVKLQEINAKFELYATRASLRDSLVELKAKDAELLKAIGQNITKLNFDTTLKNYISTEQLKTQLTDYITTTFLRNELRSYISSDDLTLRLSSYVRGSTLEDRLKGFLVEADVKGLIANKVDKSDIDMIQSNLDAHINDILLNIDDFITMVDVDNKLTEYSSKSDVTDLEKRLNSKILSFDTISDVDNKILDLEKDVNQKLVSYLKTIDFDKEITKYATNIKVDDMMKSLDDKVNAKADTSLVQNVTDILTTMIKTSISTLITEDEVDNKVKLLTDMMKTLPTTAEIDYKYKSTNDKLDSEISRLEKKIYDKVDIDNKLLEKVSLITLDNKLKELTNDLDLDNKLSNKITSSELKDELSDYTTKISLQNALSDKVDNNQLESAINTLENTTSDNITKNTILINSVSTDMSNIDTNLRKLILDNKNELKLADDTIKQSVATISNTIQDKVDITEFNNKMKDQKTELEAVILNGDTKINNNITLLDNKISTLENKQVNQIEQSHLDKLKYDVDQTITTLQSVTTSEFLRVADKFNDHLKIETYEKEKTNFAPISSVTNLQNDMNTITNGINGRITTINTNITNLGNVKLDKTYFDDYTRNIYTKAELSTLLIPTNDVFKKDEINDIVTAIKTSITKNTDKINDVDSKFGLSYTNNNIDTMINDVKSSLNTSNLNLSKRIDEKVDTNIYNQAVTRISNTLDNKVNYSDMESAISINNTKFKSAQEIDATLDNFKLVFWNDVLLGFSTTSDINKKFDLYTSLETLYTELAKYTTLEKLEAKILDINSISRTDVINMIATSEGNITIAYKKWISDLLSTYTTTSVLRDMLDTKVDVTEFEKKITEINNTYLSKVDFNTEKQKFVSTETIDGIIDGKMMSLLQSYYTKDEVDKLLDGIKSLIINNSNLFYSKDIMDDKLNLLETKAEAVVRKTSTDNAILEIRNNFNDHPTYNDMEARLNAILAGAGNISTDSFYSKGQTDSFLLTKLDVSQFNSYKDTIYNKVDIDNKFTNYISKDNYTNDNQLLDNRVSTIEKNPILILPSDKVVLEDKLNTELSEYQRKIDVVTDVNAILNTSLSNYVRNNELENKLSDFRLNLHNIDNLDNYVKMSTFDTFKDTVYNKSYIDTISTKFDDYTNTVLLDTKLNEIKSTIKTDRDILNLVQSSGGQNYTKEEINAFLRDKVDTITLDNLIITEANKNNNKFLSKNDASAEFIGKDEMTTVLDNYLHLSNGGRITGPTQIDSLTVSNSATISNLNMTSSDITNVRNITSIGESNLANVNITNLGSANNFSINNDLTSKNIRVDGRLTIPETKLSTTKTFAGGALLDYGDVNNTLSLITQAANPEFVLNLGLRSGNNILNKFIKFNSNGSLSTRNVKGVGFDGDWIELALKSDINGLELSLGSQFVKSTDLTTTLSRYVPLTTFNERMNNIYDRTSVDGMISNLNTQISNLSNTNIQQLLDQKASQTDLNTLRNDLNQEKLNRYSKTEMNTVWKTEFLTEIDTKLKDGWVSNTQLSSTLNGYVTETSFGPRLTQFGVDIMNNIGSNYVTLTTLNSKLSNYYDNEIMDVKLGLLIDRSKLDDALSLYTTTDALNLRLQGIQTQATTAVQTANTAKSQLDLFKDVVSTNYYNKSDTAIAISAEVTKQVKPLATKTELLSTRSDLENIISNNKTAIEGKLTNEVDLLNKKDNEQDEKIKDNTDNFKNYTTIQAHDQSVVVERGISDDKYLAKVDASTYATRSYVDTNVNTKVDKSGDTITGNLNIVGNLTVSNETSLKQTLIDDLTTTNDIKFNNIALVDTNTNVPITNKGIISPIKGLNDVGFLLGNSINKTENEPYGLFLKFNGNTLTYQKSDINERDSIQYYQPNEKVWTIASTDYVDNKFISELDNYTKTTIKDTISNLNNDLSDVLRDADKTDLEKKIDNNTDEFKKYVLTTKLNDTLASYSLTTSIQSIYATKENLNDLKKDLDDNYYTKPEVDALLLKMNDKITTLEQSVQSAIATSKDYTDKEIDRVLGEVKVLLDKINGAVI